MANKNTLKSFNVGAYIHVWCATSVKAATLAEATELASKLELTDFVNILGSYNDGRLQIIQVFDEDAIL